MDRLNIIAHDKFDEIIQEARKPGNPIRMASIVLEGTELEEKKETVVSQSQLAGHLGLSPAQQTTDTVSNMGLQPQPAFQKPEEQQIAQIAWSVIRSLENQPAAVPTLEHLKRPEVQAAIVKAVQEQQPVGQMELEGLAKKPDVAAIVAKTVELVTQQTIDTGRPGTLR